ncbi:GAF and ANTAR domain-containing protein [Jatrophihabitans sp. YIM 134969]
MDVDEIGDELTRVTRAITHTLRRGDGRLQATLDAVVEAATQVTGHETGLALVEDGVLAPTATTGRAPHTLDVLQLELGAGPCLDAARTQDVVVVEDTRVEDRWAPFGARARELGVASMICVPLWVDERVMGTLSLYASGPAAFVATDRHVAEICAVVSAAAVADARRSEQLREALQRRDVIGQAKGILMERDRLTADQAFERLSWASQRLNRKLFVVAEEFVATGQLPERAAR